MCSRILRRVEHGLREMRVRGVELIAIVCADAEQEPRGRVRSVLLDHAAQKLFRIVVALLALRDEREIDEGRGFSGEIASTFWKPVFAASKLPAEKSFTAAA